MLSLFFGVGWAFPATTSNFLIVGMCRDERARKEWRVALTHTQTGFT